MNELDRLIFKIYTVIIVEFNLFGQVLSYNPNFFFVSFLIPRKVHYLFSYYFILYIPYYVCVSVYRFYDNNNNNDDVFLMLHVDSAEKKWFFFRSFIQLLNSILDFWETMKKNNNCNPYTMTTTTWILLKFEKTKKNKPSPSSSSFILHVFCFFFKIKFSFFHERKNSSSSPSSHYPESIVLIGLSSCSEIFFFAE